MTGSTLRQARLAVSLRQCARRKRRLSRSAPRLRRPLLRLKAGDHGDDLVLVGLGRLAHADLLAAAQDADAVGKPEDLVEAVADDQHADVALL